MSFTSTIHKTISSNHVHLPLQQSMFSKVCVTPAGLESHLGVFSFLYQMNDDLVEEHFSFSYIE